ncbi:hydroxyacyl-CoA dehydrogenase domain protein [Brucella abortus bv. 4 str. 292]|nr:hydroxyacyl-CoA dehydrogenase domain protein [Brucella abortus bv. 4 str. 292]
MGHIKACQIEEFERPHAKSRRVSQDGVNRCKISYPFLHHRQSFRSVSTACMVDDETRRIGRIDRPVTDPDGKLLKGIHHRITRQRPLDNLHDAHQRNGIEKMEARDPLGIFCAGCNSRHRKGRRIRRYHGLTG